jgi:hypothetical protein
LRPVCVCVSVYKTLSSEWLQLISAFAQWVPRQVNCLEPVACNAKFIAVMVVHTLQQSCSTQFRSNSLRSSASRSQMTPDGTWTDRNSEKQTLTLFCARWTASTTSRGPGPMVWRQHLSFNVLVPRLQQTNLELLDTVEVCPGLSRHGIILRWIEMDRDGAMMCDVRTFESEWRSSFNERWLWWDWFQVLFHARHHLLQDGLQGKLPMHWKIREGTRTSKAKTNSWMLTYPSKGLK